jgi:hypothetical protein
MIRSAIGRTKARLGVVFRAARKAIGTAIAMASSVPSVAMLIVSQRGSQIFSRYDQRSGSAPTSRLFDFPLRLSCAFLDPYRQDR